MHRLLEKLKRDHRNLERILDLLTLELDRFFAGEASNFDLKIELMEYIETYADQVHHPLENLIYDLALTKGGEQNELLQRLCQQHSQLIQLTRTFRHSLENILQDGMMARAELEVQGREYIALQHQHIDLEENEAFPYLEQALSDADWAQISDQQRGYDDPVFETPDQVRFHTLVEYLAANDA